MAEGQPDRGPGDGEVGISRDPDGRIVLRCETDGTTTSVRMGPHNAWRALALLAFMLDVSLPKALLRRIEL